MTKPENRVRTSDRILVFPSEETVRSADLTSKLSLTSGGWLEHEELTSVRLQRYGHTH
jgi:hypothetical protein